MIGMKSQKPKSGQYLSENCICVSSEHYKRNNKSGIRVERRHILYLPEHVVAQTLHTARADEDVKRWAPRGSKMSLEVVYGDCATFIKSMFRI